MFYNHVIGYYDPIVAISSSMYDPGNREFHLSSRTDRQLLTIDERALKGNIYDTIIKDPVASNPRYKPSDLEIGDLILFAKDKVTIVGYIKIDSMEGIRLPKE